MCDRATAMSPRFYGVSCMFPNVFICCGTTHGRYTAPDNGLAYFEQKISFLFVQKSVWNRMGLIHTLGSR